MSLAAGIICNKAALWKIGLVIGAQSLIFLGIRLAVPVSLNIALEDYKDALVTAGSIFGMSYYVIIAILTALMGFLHNGTVFPISLYFVVLTLFLLLSASLLQKKYSCMN